ncbi:MAG TPA: hypothetical protein VGR84_18820 [Candidatus Acidoferrales bacterium]|nr:hypothetical protein [Candidatus Acidoferrales bacterium]
MKNLIAAGALLVLAGCTTPISNNPIASTPGAQVLGDDLVAAAFNLNSAISIHVLPPDDPAAACINTEVTQLGLGQGAPAAESFVPENKGLISAGAIVYIHAQQIKAQLGGLTQVPVSCEALVGKLVVDAIQAGNQIGLTLIKLPKIP